jgi:hypothetical protein
LTRKSNRRRFLARARAKASAIFCLMLKEFPAMFASSFSSESDFATFRGAITAALSGPRVLKGRFAELADELLLWHCNLSAAGMGMETLARSVAGPRASKSAIPLYVGFEPKKLIAADRTNEANLSIGRLGLPADTVDLGCFHEAIISRKTVSHQDLITVYNIEVEEDHSYVAAGVVVHNCLNCLARDGEIYAVRKPFPSHPACRCSAIPIIEGRQPRAESAAEWFRRLPDETKRTMMSGVAFDLYKQGKIKLADFKGEKKSRKWGAVTYQRSVKEILGE